MRAGLYLVPVLFASSAAFAAGDKSYATLALTKTQDVSEADSDTGERDVTVINLSAGYGIGSGVVIGAKFFDYSYDDKILDDTGTTITGYGPMLGYYHDTGFFVQAAYLYKPTKEVKTSAGKFTYNDDYGYAIDIGKAFEVSQSFGVALQLTQSKVYYKKLKAPSGTEEKLHGTWSDASLYPYVAAFVYF